MRRPPSSGPRATATPLTAPYMPKALPRSLGGKATWMMARMAGFITPAIAPCATRQPMSAGGLPAVPQRAEVRVKPASPIRKRRLWP